MFPLRDTVPSRHPPVMTWALIAANALVFLYQLTLPPQAQELLAYRFGIVPARFTDPYWASLVGFPADHLWPFLTSMFLHGSFFHILANMWTLWIFGDNVEDRMGPFRFLVFYLLCGFAAGGIHWLTNLDSTLPTIGASGAIAGVLGAYLALYPRARILTFLPIFIIPLFFELPAFVYLGIWFISQLFNGTFSLGTDAAAAGGVAWWAHVGGFLAGLLLFPLFLRREPEPLLPPERHFMLPRVAQPGRPPLDRW
ncbi:MAG TPA: rhomboid family intramembrane serine protease [Thermoanaerobaculia bacterium]|nr:rhomboid family intramembrane serine protease [Thermoanaerobaculia bacterium]